MGNEARCRVEIGAETADDAKALLETEELIVRGPLRARIRFSDGRDVIATGGVLSLTWQDQRVRIHLGPDAAKWAGKIRNPKSVIEKLGVKSGQRVSIVSFPDETFAAQLAASGADVSPRARKDSDVIFLGAKRREDLVRLGELKELLVPNGAIWVIRPKGTHRREVRRPRNKTFTARWVKTRVGILRRKSLLVRVNYKAAAVYEPVSTIHLPLSERVLDRLADILFATDEILDMIRTAERLPDATTNHVERSVRHVYDEVNELMKKLAD